MTVALTSSPVVPLPGQTVLLTASGTAGNLLEFFLTSGPAGSRLVTGRLASYAQSFVPDVTGIYTFTVNDWVRNYTAPGFPGDPLARPTLTLSSSVSSQTVSVGQVLTRTIGAEPDVVDLKLIVQGTTIVAAMLLNPRTQAADLASQDSAVLLALNACTNISVSSLDDTLQTKVNSIRAAYEAHRVLTTGSVHAAVDATNFVRTNLNVSTDEGAIAALNDIRYELTQHMLNRVTAPATAPHTFPDATDVIRVGSASDKRTGHSLADNTWTIYEAHRVKVTGTPGNVHGLADSTNVLAAQKPLAALQSTLMTAAFNAALATPQGQHGATVTLTQAHGFR